MANTVKINPVAIDIPIQETQTKLYNKLGYDQSVINGHGRCYLIDRNDDVIPMRHISGTDYKDVLVNDKYDCQYFCIEDKKTTPNGPKYNTQVDWIFLMNTANLKPGVAHRADEECFVDVLRVFARVANFTIDEIVKGKDALEGFDTDLEDRGNWHFIKVTGTYNYKINC